jgi:hypothetical protein
VTSLFPCPLESSLSVHLKRLINVLSFELNIVRNERQEPIKFFPAIVFVTKSMFQRIKALPFVTDMNVRPKWISRLFVDHTCKGTVLNALATDIAYQQRRVSPILILDFEHWLGLRKLHHVVHATHAAHATHAFGAAVSCMIVLALRGFGDDAIGG